MKQVVVCSECRNIYLRRPGEERCPFCVGAPGEVIMDLTEEVEEVSLPARTEEKPKVERKRGK